MNNASVPFESLDLGSGQAVAVPMETIEVVVSSDNLLGNYAKAFVNEAQRVNPLKAEQVSLTEAEVKSYADFLLEKRIQSVHLNCPEWRKLKVFYVPSFIQYALSMIGEVVLRDQGIKLVPVKEAPSDLSFEEALAISEKIGSLENDLQIVRDAMPRGIEGDRDVMSTALIAGYVRALRPVQHVASTYVTAFLGLKLKEELAFKVLYRVQYDDLAFIASALTAHKGIF